MAEGGWVVTHRTSPSVSAPSRSWSAPCFYNTVLENATASIIVKDARDLRYLLLNRASEEFYGIPRDRMIGKTVRDVLPLGEAEGVEARDRHLLEVGEGQIINVRPVRFPGNGRRTVNSTRLAIKARTARDTGQPAAGRDRAFMPPRRASPTWRISTDSPTCRTGPPSTNASPPRSSAPPGEGALCAALPRSSRFKEVNDVFGHAVDDTAAAQGGGAARQCIREAFLARLGGDEFAVIVSSSARPAGATALADA